MAAYDNLLANVPTDLWIGGKWKKSSDNARFDVIDPATEQKIASVASAVDRRRQGRARRRAGRLRSLGREEAARARRNPAQGLRTDHARRRAAREADHHRERQGAVGFARRGGLRRRVLPLVRRGGRAQSRRQRHRAVVGRAHLRAPQAGRHRRAGDAVEFPGRDGDAQDRPGAGRRLPGDPEARLRDAAHHAGADADPGRGRRAGRRRQRHPVAPLGPGGRHHAARSARPRGLVHRLDRSRPQAPAQRRRPGAQDRDGTRRQRAVHRVRGRRHRRRHRRRDDRQDAQHGRGLHRGQPLLRAREGAGRVRQEAHRQDGRAQDGQRPRRRRGARAPGQRRRPRQGDRTGRGRASARAPRF